MRKSILPELPIIYQIPLICIVFSSLWISLFNNLLLPETDNVIDFQLLKDWGLVILTNAIVYRCLRGHNQYKDCEVEALTPEISIESRQSKQALLSNEERFRAAVMDAPFPLMIHAEDGEILEVNQVWAELTGYTPAEIPTIADWTEQAYRESKEAAQAIIDQLYSLNQRIDEGEFTITTKEGNTLIWHFSSAPLGKLPDGRRLVISMAMDITEQKRAEKALRESETRFRRLVESNLIGMVIGDSRGNLTYANDAFLAPLGYTREEMERGEVDWIKITPPEYLDLDWQKIAEARKLGISTPYEKEYFCKDGSHITILIRLALLDEQKDSILALILDITELKQAQKALEIRLHQQAVVAQLGHRALAGLPLSRLLDEATTLVAQSLDVEYCKVLELCEDGQVLFLRSGVGWQPGLVGHTKLNSLTNSQAGYTLISQHPVIVEDLTTETRFHGPKLLLKHKVISGMSVIIPGENHPFGVLGAHTIHKRKFTQDDINFLQAVANVLSAAIEHQKAEAALKESEERFRHLADAAPVLIWMSDVNQGCYYVNKTSRDFTGRTMEQEEGKAWLAGVHPEDRQHCWDTYEAAFAAHQEFRSEYRLKRFDGEYRWLLNFGIPRFTSEGEFLGYIGTGIDINDRILAKAQMEELNQNLEQQVKERTSQLQAANAELEAFSYSVSHDLRAPLRHISGFVDLLEKHLHSKQPDATSTRYLEIITQTTKQAGKLIDNLLAFSRMGRVAMNYTTINMNLLVQAVQNDLQLEIARRQINWHIDQLPEVMGDPSLLRLVVHNLMDNALKYTRKNICADITIGSFDQEQEIVFFCGDNGVGFDMHYVDKLFGIFQRLHSEQEFEGTGIGLANVQRIIHRHGGRTWAKARVNHGATFYFSLPKQP